MAMDDLTREFLIESQEGLDRMERCLTELESKPSDTGLLAEIFRTVHTIKGTTGFLGFKRLEKLAHSGENLLGLLREGKLAADKQVITGLLALQDGLRSILRSIEVEASEGEDTDAALIARLEELQVPAMAMQGKGKSSHAGTAVKEPLPAAENRAPGGADIGVTAAEIGAGTGTRTKRIGRTGVPGCGHSAGDRHGWKSKEKEPEALMRASRGVRSCI